MLWLPVLVRTGASGFGDWQYFHHMWEAGRVAVERHGELPLWDPHHCGGVTLWGNPQAQVYGPLFPLVFLVGTTWASKIFLVLHTAAGLAGMYLLGRWHYGLGAAGASIAAVAWAWSGFFMWHGLGGHAAFMPFYFAPWLLLAWRASLDRSLRWSVAVALIVLVTLLEGGVYPAPFFVLLLLADGLFWVIAHRRVGRVLAAGAASASLAVLLGAVRIVPTLITLHDFDRPELVQDRLDAVTVFEMLLHPSHAWADPEHQFRWAEYGAYVGIGAVVLALIGVFGARRGRRHIIAGALLFLALMVGAWGPYSPFGLLRQLPVYGSLRVPSRFVVLFLLYVALLVGVGNQALARLIRERWGGRWPRLGQLAPWVPVALVATELLVVNYRPMWRWDHPPLSTEAPVGRFHLVASRNYWMEYASYPQRNVGIAACYDAIEWDVAPGLWHGDRPQVRLAPARAGEVRAFGRTSNTVWAEVDLQNAARVVFNQNHARGWSASTGAVVEDRGRLAVDVPEGEHRIVARYRPPRMGLALGATLLGLLLSVAVVLARRPRLPEVAPDQKPEGQPPSPTRGTKAQAPRSSRRTRPPFLRSR